MPMREAAASQDHAADWQAPNSEIKLQVVPPAPEQKEAARETVKSHFEYRDAAGNSLGYAVMEVSAKKSVHSSDGRPFFTVDLVTLKLEGVKDGQPTSVDVLAKMNPHGVRILIATAADAYLHNAYDVDDDTVTCETPDNPISLGILGHELGHASQHRDPAYEALTSADFFSRSELFQFQHFQRWDLLVDHARTVIKSVPELGAINSVDEDVLNEMRQLDEELLLALTEASEIKLQLDDAKQGEAAIERHQAIQFKLRAMTVEYHLFDIVNSAKKIIERDATRRSLGNLRALRDESGVDVLTTTFYDKRLPADSDCEAEVISYVENANHSLESYEANRWRFGQEEDGPRVTPMMGGDRVEKTAATEDQQFFREVTLESIIEFDRKRKEELETE